ncbi:hypothetical protein MTR_6g088365 [Medicago truncatula]|uniref:Uncharacterized protein n=1 Tax=Medicago truncatula TaxID=3880 RepID=A0A072UMT3_MEDTR|nr:hypothetical protein MTR_6g088365 [Medicago truncatula]
MWCTVHSSWSSFSGAEPYDSLSSTTYQHTVGLLIGPEHFQRKVFVRFRLLDQLRSSADPTNDFGVINVSDLDAWLFRRF